MTKKLASQEAGRTSETDLRSLSLLSLMSKLATDLDQAALSELTESRTVFPADGTTDINLVAFLEARRAELTEYFDGEIVHEACHRVRAKFGLVGHATPVNGRRCVDPKRYYRAVVKRVTQDLAEVPAPDIFVVEGVSAKRLRGMVKRQFSLSLREVLRDRHAGTSRYNWQREDGTITVRMPRWITGRDRRQWLEANVPKPNADAPGEARRVQEVIDQRLGSHAPVSVEELPPAMEAAVGSVPPEQMQEEVIRGGLLGRVVAREKAACIGAQRRAIQSLGPSKLKALVRHIFNCVAGGDYNERATARRFGLSNATLNRFAGINWASRQADTSPTRIPDLWRNTAALLAACPVFREAVAVYGLRGKLRDMVGGESAGGVQDDT